MRNKIESMKKCIILANGDAPKKSDITFFLKKGYSTLICADGGADTAKKLKLIPDYIIGDLDSISSNTLLHYQEKCRIIKMKRQNDTDVEKCLKFAIKNGYTEAILLGATGSRLDHSFCNLGIVLKFYNEIKIKILHDDSLLEVISGNITLTTKKNETISLYGIDEMTKVSSRGLKYRLKNMALPFGKKESTSNVANGKSVELNVTKGKMFLIRDFNVMKNNDLI